MLGYISYWALVYFGKISILSVSMVLAGILLFVYYFGRGSADEKPVKGECLGLFKITRCKGALFLVNASIFYYLSSKLYPNLFIGAPDWAVVVIIVATIFASYWIATFFCLIKDFFE